MGDMYIDVGLLRLSSGNRNQNVNKYRFSRDAEKKAAAMRPRNSDLVGIS
jgi:hypothetical protein